MFSRSLHSDRLSDYCIIHILYYFLKALSPTSDMYILKFMWLWSQWKRCCTDFVSVPKIREGKSVHKSTLLLSPVLIKAIAASVLDVLQCSAIDRPNAIGCLFLLL